MATWRTAALAAVVLACGDDGQSPTATDGGVEPIPLPAIPGGGTTGGSILGRLVVYVLAAGTPLREVSVAVDTPSGRLTGKTDAEGRLEFSQPGLRGPVTITAFLPDTAHYSVAGVDAAAVSLDIFSDPGTPSQEAFAVGRVSGWDVLAPLDAPDTTPFAEVRPIARSVLAPSFEWAQALRPDLPLPTNIVRPDVTQYRLRLDTTNTTGVFALAGHRPIVEGPGTTFEFLALAPGLTWTAGATVTADLTLSIPLERPIRVDTSQRPPLPFVVLLPTWQLPDGGTVTLAEALPVEGTPLSFLAPAVVAETEVGAVAVARDELGQQSIRWFPIPGDSIDMPGFLALPTPRKAGPRTVQSANEGLDGDLQQWFLFKDGRIAWRMDVLGPTRRGPVVWPPALDGFDDPVSGERVVTVTSLDFGGIDPDRVSFTQLSVVLRGLALGFATLSF